jgi:DNA-binding NarL/FixJ family response regulator
MSVRILLADDHRILREGLRSLIAQQPDLELAGEAASGEEAIALARQTKPDVVIMDVVLPGIDGVEATRRIHSEFREIRIIALSMHSDRRYVSEMLRAGAIGYLVKDGAFEELNLAIRTVVAGRPYLSTVITGSLVEDFVRQTSAQEPASATSPLGLLTTREVEVLRLLANGKRVKDIAAMLNISVKTVESHRQNVMDKLEIHSTIELTRYALREGLATV